MDCNFCGNKFANKQNLTNHQKKAKYCLKIQGIKQDSINDMLECDGCLKSFAIPSNYRKHVKICKKNDLLVKMNNKIVEQETVIHELRKQIVVLQEDYKELSLVAVKRPSSKNIQINNYIKNMPPLLESDITDNVQYLTLEHHAKGVEGYAEYALEFPFKDKIVCVDVARNKIKYKNEDGDIIDDVGFRKMMIKLCSALKDRSYNLSQEHYEKISEKFTEKEMDGLNFMETAVAIAKCANGRDTDFCNQIVKMISKEVSK